MPWSSAVADDALRRYLRQQAELGGAEVILPRPLAPREAGRALVVAPARPVAPAGSAGAPAPVAQAGAPAPRGDRRLEFAPGAAPAQPEAPAAATGAPKARWRDGAPPIPGPGLTITTPAPDLLAADAIGALPTLDAVAARVAGCRACGLCEGRTQSVPGEGNPTARLMLVGEGPGATEDQTGRPFVGQAGQLLDRILESIECPRETVFIANIVKCRPPQNRKPLPDEMQACLPFLRRQIALVRPTVLLALGSTAAEGLLGVKKSLGELRLKVHRYDGIPLVVTYHPAALLRNPNWKKPTWDDVRIARQLLDG